MSDNDYSEQLRNDARDEVATYTCFHRCVRCRRFGEYEFETANRPECPHDDDTVTCESCAGDVADCAPECPNRTNIDAHCIPGCADYQEELCAVPTSCCPQMTHPGDGDKVTPHYISQHEDKGG